MGFSGGCCHRAAHAEPETIETYSLPVLEARRLKSRCWQSHVPSKAPGAIWSLPLPVSGGCWHLVACGCMSVCAVLLLPPSLLDCVLSLCLSLGRTFGMTPAWVIQGDLLSKSLTSHLQRLFLKKKVTCSRCQDLMSLGGYDSAYHTDCSPYVGEPCPRA